MNILFLIEYRHLYWEPLGIAYLASVAKQKGCSVHLLNIDRDENVAEAIKAIAPEVIAYSISTVQAKRMIGFNQELKQRLNFLSIFGGPHPTFFPEMIEESGVDVVCRGEGEEPFGDWIECLQQARDYTWIPNLWVKNSSGAIIKNSLRPFVEDLDQLLVPDRSLFEQRPELRRSYKPFMAGRGCPYKCSFCFNHINSRLASGRYVRLHSVDRVISEISQTLARYPSEAVYFHDDTFGMNLEWLREFSDKYSRHVNKPFLINMRADMIDEERVRLLSKAGCACVHMGLETGNDKLRNEYLKKDLARTSFISAARLLRCHGINFELQNMIGLPGETILSVLDTIEINVRCQPAQFNLAYFIPFGHLELTKLAIERGEIPCEGAKIPDTFHEKIVLDLADKDEMRFLGSMAGLLIEFPLLFPLVRWAYHGNHRRVKLWVNGFLLLLDRILKKFPNRKTKRCLIDIKRYWRGKA